MTGQNPINAKEPKLPDRTEQGKPKEWIAFLCFAGVIFMLGAIPVVWDAPFKRVTLYYGSLLFAVLISASILAILHVEPHSHREERDYRVAHYALRLGLIFGIGAVIIAILIVASQMLGLRGN